MLHFFTHWTKKRIIICAISVVLAGTAFFGAYTMLGPDGGITDITPPDNSDNGTSLRPEGKTVADMTDDPKQNLYIANGVLSEAGSFKSETVGQTVSTKIGFSVTQDIYALRVVKGSTVYKQSSSYGLVKMGDERFAHGDTYLYRTAGDVKSVTNMKWPDGEPKKLEKDEFFERYGSRGNGLTGYILNDETIVSATYNGYDEATGLYSFTYVLDNQKATVKMLYEMRTNSGSKNFGTFEKAIITVTMDKDWVVRTLTTDCAYNVPIAGNTPCKEDMVETFSDIGKIDSYEQMPCHDYYNKYVDFSAELPADDNGDNDQPFTPALPAPAEPQPLDVLMGMFETYLDGTTPLNAKLTTKVKDFDIAADITLRLDLQNLANTTFAAITDGELRLTYANNNIYAAVNNIKLRSSVDDVMNIVKRYAGNSLPTDLGSLDIDPTAILESMSLQEVDGKVIVTIPLSLGKIELQATLVGTKNDDGTYAFAEATVAVNGIEIKLTAQDKTIETIAPDDSFVDACALFAMVEPYINGDPLNARLATKVKDFDIAADITLRLDLQNLANTTFAAITDGELRLTYANNNIYAAVNNIKLRSSVDDVMNIVKRYAGNSLPTDLGSLDIDPTAILESMSLQEVDGKVIVTIPLSLGKIELQATLVGTKNDDGTYAFAEATVAVNGIEIKLTAQDKTIETIAPDDSFVDACALFAMVEPYINGDPLNARLATKVKDFDIAADITLRLDLQNLANTTFAAITGGGLRLTYANNNIYAAVNNVKLRSTVSDIMNIARRYAGNSLPTDLGSLDIDATTILESMSLQEIDGKVIVKVPLSLGKIELEATLVGIQNDDGTYAFAEATVAVNGIEIKLTAQDKTIETITPDDTYINIASVIDDYADVISRIADTKTPDRTQTAHKSWTFTIDPVTIVADGQTYTTEAMTLHLYLSPSRIAVKSDPFVLTTKSADGKETKTSLLLGGAYELPTTKNDGKLYLTINDLINPTSDIKVSIGRQALVDCFNKRLPELLDAIPQLKELTNMQFDVAKLLDLSALLSELKYDRDNDKTLSLTIDASQIFGSLGTLQVTLSQPQDGAIRLSLAQQETTALTIQSLAITAAADSDVPTDEQIAAAYDTTQPHTSLDSIDTLLQSLINTAKRTSFRLTGEIPVNLSVIGIINADITIDLDIRIDVEKNENAKDTVYIAAKLSRGKLSGLTTIAFADKGGDSYLYYNGKDGTITLKRNSYNDHKWCKVCKNYTCTNGWHTGFKEERVLLDTDFYGKCSYEETVTEQQFVDNMFDYIMKLINFSDTINNTITGAINKDDKAEFGIDDILVAYNYDNPYYNLTLDLKPVDNVLGKVNVKIAHDEQYNLTSLTGDIQLLDITGVSAKGTFDIKLIDSEYGDAKQLTLQTTVF